MRSYEGVRKGSRDALEPINSILVGNLYACITNMLYYPHHNILHQNIFLIDCLLVDLFRYSGKQAVKELNERLVGLDDIREHDILRHNMHV